MTLQDFLLELCTYLPIIPAAVFCFLPMRQHMKWQRRSVILTFLLLFAVLVPVGIGVNFLFHVDSNIIFSILMIIFFTGYNHLLTTRFSQNLNTFCLCGALMAVCSNFSRGFDAWLHPYTPADSFSLEASLFQCGCSFLLVLILAWPVAHYGSRLVHSLKADAPWYTMALVSCTFFLLNIVIIPHNYQVLYSYRVFIVFWQILVSLLFMLCFIYFVFYFVARTILANAENSRKLQLMNMQESLYQRQQQYMEQTAVLRHNFRQTVVTLQGLVKEQEYASLSSYLDEYMKTLPIKETSDFCHNYALNSLLNYYQQVAQNQQIHTHWKIQLPYKIPVGDVDLCTLVGNLLENVVKACNTVSDSLKYHDLSVTVENEKNLCIVSTNNFDGKVNKRNGQYLPVHRQGGSGIGLSSIEAISEKYHGFARFSHVDNEFFIDIMIPLWQDLPPLQ